jgi:hypothetical protein
MAIATQPSGLKSNFGAVVTIGIRSSGDRCEIVLPMATDKVSLTAKDLCLDVCSALDVSTLDLLAACLSEDAYISFVQAVGMDDGFVPARLDMAPTDYPGTGTPDCETSQVAGLIVYYAEPADLAPDQRMPVGKNFIPGIPDDDLTGDAISSGLQTNLEAFADELCNGFEAVGGGSYKWYRVMATPPKGSEGVDLMRVGVFYARGYSGTQRRRLIPH